MIDYLLEYAWQIVLGLISLVAYIVRLEGAIKRNSERYEDMQNKIKELEEASIAGRESMRRDLSTFRTEVQNNFSKLDATLEKVIFKLGDKADKD